MTSLSVAGLSLACIVGGVIAGFGLQRILPEEHLRGDARDVVKLGSGLIGTLAALVLGLLVGSAKVSYDTMNDGLKQSCARAILLDRILARYGAEADTVRSALRNQVGTALKLLWPTNPRGASGLSVIESLRGPEAVQEACAGLVPRNEAQQALRTQALQICAELGQSRWLMIEHAQNSLPVAFLIVLVTWLALLHLAFGLLAPVNATVVTVLLVCAVSVSAALLLILELNHPVEGLIQLSSAPLLKAQQLLGQ